MQDNYTIDRPVFVIGTARCGLSPLMNLIAYHREFAWPSQYNNQHPNKYWLSFLSRLIDLPWLNASPLKYRRFPRHVESFFLWNNLFLGFSRPFRDLTADDVTPHVKSKFRHAIGEIMKYQGKTRFIAEYSGWSRIRFIKCIFPDAQFIHIVRDGRAVANSFLNVKWWQGWEGIYKWRWGVPREELLAKLEKYDYSFLALAAVHWKILIDNLKEQSQLLPREDLLLVRYEDMVKHPYEEAYRCIQFCGLDENCQKFKKHLSTVKIVDANNQSFRIPSWRENFSDKQIDMLNDILKDELIYFNYLPAGSTNGRASDLQKKVTDKVSA